MIVTIREIKILSSLFALLFSLSLFSQKYLPKSSGEVIKHKYFTLSYNESHEQANWVHYKLNPSFLSGNTPRNISPWKK